MIKCANRNTKVLVSQGDDTLVRSKYLRLYSFDSIPAVVRERYDAIKQGNLKTARARIASIQKRACSFRNRDHLKIAVYFHCGSLDLYPVSATHGIPG